MLKRLIRNLRQRSKESRDRIAFGAAASFTLLVFGAWAYHFSAPETVVSVLGVAEEDEEVVEETPGAFSQMFDKVGGQIAAIKESLTDQMEVPTTTEATTVTPTTESSDEAFEQFLEQNPIISDDEGATAQPVLVESGATLHTSSTSIDVPQSSAPPASSKPVVQSDTQTVRIITTKATATASSTPE